MGKAETARMDVDGSGERTTPVASNVPVFWAVKLLKELLVIPSPGETPEKESEKPREPGGAGLKVAKSEKNVTVAGG